MILSLYINRNQITHSHDPVAHILGPYLTVNVIQQGFILFFIYFNG